MFKNLRLTRPLAVIDLETTGTQPQFDRIVEISVLKIFPDGSQEQRTRRLNPGVPIPKEASEIHGITDADVATEPTFPKVAESLRAFLEGCDLCGYNVKKFDLRMLHAEFERAGLPFSYDERFIVDPLEIFVAYEPRHLAAAVRLFLGEEHNDAHSAAADVLATARVLDAMLARYTDLPRTVEELNVRFKDPNTVDVTRKFSRVGGEIRFNFGKHRGVPLEHVAKNDPEYLKWIMNGDFANDVKAIVRDALAKALAGNPSPPK